MSKPPARETARMLALRRAHADVDMGPLMPAHNGDRVRGQQIDTVHGGPYRLEKHQPLKSSCG